VVTALRNAKKPLTTQDIAMRVMAERGLDTANVRLLKTMTKRAGACPTLINATGRVAELREKYPELAAQAAARPRPKRPYRVRKPGGKKLGRPPHIAGEKKDAAEKMYLDGASMKTIASLLSINLTSVYSYFGVNNREYWEKRKAEYQAQQRNRR
jgi:hypothetical protein